MIMEEAELECQPWVKLEGGLAAVAIVVQQLFAGLDVTLCHQHQVGHPFDDARLRLEVAALAVVH